MIRFALSPLTPDSVKTTMLGLWVAISFLKDSSEICSNIPSNVPAHNVHHKCLGYTTKRVHIPKAVSAGVDKGYWGEHEAIIKGSGFILEKAYDEYEEFCCSGWRDCGNGYAHYSVYVYYDSSSVK